MGDNAAKDSRKAPTGAFRRSDLRCSVAALPGRPISLLATAGVALRVGSARTFGSRDRINCGPGRDVAHVDRNDSVTACEVVRYA